jgi:hypothetical protein
LPVGRINLVTFDHQASVAPVYLLNKNDENLRRTSKQKGTAANGSEGYIRGRSEERRYLGWNKKMKNYSNGNKTKSRIEMSGQY